MQLQQQGTVAVSDECAALYAEGYRLIHGQASPLAKAAACKYIDTEFLIKCWLVGLACSDLHFQPDQS